MILNLFKISLFYAGVIVLLHAVVPHEHHADEKEYVHHQEHEEPESLFGYIEQALHFSGGHECHNSYAVNSSSNLDLMSEEPKGLSWFRNPSVFIEYKLSFESKIEKNFSLLDENLSRGPPYLS